MDRRNILRRLSARTKGRTIGLYGGSFNPAHKGHLHIANEAIKRLGLDEIWLLVSPGNPLKSETGMAPFEQRLASIRTLVGSHPKMHVTDIEQTLATRFTCDTIHALHSSLPEANFIWVMGADNLVGFNKWQNWQDITEMLPIAVFDRAGYAIQGFSSDLARHYRKFRTTAKTLKRTLAPAWAFVTIPRHDGCATDIRNQHGTNWFVNEQGKDT